MAAICLVQPVGHALALDAMTAVSENRPQGGSRFGPLVRLLRATENTALRVAVVQFANTLVTAPEELDVRVHLRNEFQIAGFQQMMPELHATESEELNFQLTIFEEEAEDDWNELLHRFHDVQFDMTDESECAMYLQNLVHDTAAEPYYLSILQHLLLIRDDHFYRCVRACVCVGWAWCVVLCTMSPFTLGVTTIIGCSMVLARLDGFRLFQLLLQASR